MASRHDRRGRPGPQPKPPTPREWADATVHVRRLSTEDPDATTVEITKTIERGGRKWTKSVWLNIHQLRAIARDHAG